MTEKEAKRKAAKLNAEQTNLFCPLIKAKCRIDCISFCKAEAFKSDLYEGELTENGLSDNLWAIRGGGYCTNYSIVGDI